MKFSKKSLGLLLAAAASGLVTASISSTVTTSLKPSTFGVDNRNGVFGVHKLSNGDIVKSIARGGSTAAAVAEEDEDVEEEPQILYLPGLLSAVVTKRTVRSIYSFFIFVK
jgi:hypothetical protein